MLKFLSFLCVATLLFPQYYSQCGQDKYVYEHFFKDKKNGIFVDIGAHDGISLSNTYFFEKELNWSGICIEPNPDVYPKLLESRKAYCINGCITPTGNDQLHYYKITGYAEMLSGIFEFYEPRHLDRISKAIKDNGGSAEKIKVKNFILNDLLDRFAINHVDFLSLDVEGGELAILRSINFSKYTIDVITVENNYHDPDFKTFLTSQGYQMVTSLSSDQVFIRSAFLNKLENDY